MIFKTFQILICACALIMGTLPADAAGSAVPDKSKTPMQLLPEYGMTYSFQCTVSRKDAWQMKIPGVRKPVLRNDSLMLNTAGLIQRKKTSSAENVELEYEIGILNGVVNGLTVDAASLPGQKAGIRITPRETTVLLPNRKKNTADNSSSTQDFQQTLLHDSSARLPQVKTSSIPPEELLASLFPYPADQLEDYIPDWKELKEDKEIKIVPAAVIQKLRNSGFSFKDNQLSATVKRGKRLQFRGIWVFPIHLEMTSESIPGYDFQFSMSLFFAEKNPAAPLRIQRKFLEITDRILPADNPWYSGNVIQVIRSEEINMTFLPWQKKSQ